MNGSKKTREPDMKKRKKSASKAKNKDFADSVFFLQDQRRKRDASHREKENAEFTKASRGKRSGRSHLKERFA